jgi:hypothetical protein
MTSNLSQKDAHILLQKNVELANELLIEARRVLQTTLDFFVNVHPSVTEAAEVSLTQLNAAINTSDTLKARVKDALVGRAPDEDFLLLSVHRHILHMVDYSRLVMYRGHPSWRAQRMVGRRREDGYLALSRYQLEAYEALVRNGWITAVQENEPSRRLRGKEAW